MDTKIKRDKKLRKEVRNFRIRKKVKGTNERPRLLFIKTLKYLYAQIINDETGKTITGFTTLKKETIKSKSLKNLEASNLFGEFVGKKMKEIGIKQLVFDRNGYLYHGRVKTFADAVRKEGINF
ncbi:MAG: 50S ribosomal protein L18 [Elusimicrobiota bacterium]|jgi:large subunit ribosomal protein L18|nr:50S ribosomal protein L18 [Elusimicrobiota bacterium]